MAYDDDDLLRIVGEERRRSIGFGEGDGGELSAERETALAFYKGDMINVAGEHQVPSLPGRSRAVDSTLADAIETVLPDVMEIFTGGEDIATLVPQGEADEAMAQDESDFLTHVVMVQNEGFLNLYTAFKDALLVRTGILHWWWEEKPKAEIQARLSQEHAAIAPMLQAVGQLAGRELAAAPQDDGSVTLTSTELYGKVCIKAYPPEDFTVARDTVSLKETTYCAVRSRPRVQELIARGVDPALARGLSAYVSYNENVELARDEAGEHDLGIEAGVDDLRVVEVRDHYVRLAGDDGQLSVWRVMTDAEERTLLAKEEVGQIPFAALTPYIIPHRFYGESVADKLIEVQKIKTVLLRAGLDNIYFSLNQRMEVSEQSANEHTIADLLRNEPGVPVRSKDGNSVRPISAGPLNVDTWGALEYAATMAEGRSGIVRNAQGLNPDTLHSTASGALALMNLAQRRVRMIARIFAETGLKDMFLGVHAMLRSSFTAQHAPPNAKIRNKWRTAKPNLWPERDAMNIHIGVGSAGKDHELGVSLQRLNLMEKVISMQEGVEGPLVTADDVYHALNDWERAAGSKKSDQYWTDPSHPATVWPEHQPQGNPDVAKFQAQQQLEGAKAMGQARLAQAQAAAQANLDQQKIAARQQSDQAAAANDMALQKLKLDSEMKLKAHEFDQNLALERWKAEQALQLQREEVAATIALKREELRLRGSVDTDVIQAVDELPG